MKVVTQAEFETITAQEPVVLVDFFATWCGPCKMLGPVLEELSTEMANDLTIVKVDVDQSQELAMKYGIMSVPTMILFKAGQPVKQLQGFQPKPQLKAVLEELIK